MDLHKNYYKVSASPTRLNRYSVCYIWVWPMFFTSSLTNFNAEADLTHRRFKFTFHLVYYLVKLIYPADTHCNAKTHYRKCEANIPRKETARLQSQFLHSCFCERVILYIPLTGQPILLQPRKIGGPNVGIYRSLTDTWMWKLGLEAAQFLFREYIISNFFAVCMSQPA
jgi:hypothetical protein